MKFYRFMLISFLGLAAFLALWLHDWNKISSHRGELRPTVKIEKLIMIRKSADISVLGIIRPEQGIEVSAPVSGVVSAVHFASGQWLRKGEPIIELANSDLKAKLSEDLEKYYYSKRQYFRYKRLFMNGALASSELDQLRSNMKALKSQCDLDEGLLDKTLIRAPFSGKLGINRVSVGQYIAEGSSIVSLNNFNHLYIDFSVPQKLSTLLSLGQSLKISLETNKSENFQGKISSFGGKLASDTRTLNVRGEIIGPYSVLLPGMYAKVVIHVRDQNPSVQIPESALNYSPKGVFVYALNHDHVRQEFVSDLKAASNPDVKVVISGAQKLFDGASVRVVQ